MLVKNRDKYVKNWLGYEGFKFDKKTFSIFLNSFFSRTNSFGDNLLYIIWDIGGIEFVLLGGVG